MAWSQAESSPPNIKGIINKWYINSARRLPSSLPAVTNVAISIRKLYTIQWNNSPQSVHGETGEWGQCDRRDWCNRPVVRVGGLANVHVLRPLYFHSVWRGKYGTSSPLRSVSHSANSLHGSQIAKLLRMLNIRGHKSGGDWGGVVNSMDTGNFRPFVKLPKCRRFQIRGFYEIWDALQYRLLLGWLN